MTILFPIEERRTELENLAGLGYSIEQIAMYFEFDPIHFAAAAEDPESNIYYHIRRGILLTEASEKMGLLTEAQGGEANASKQLGLIRRTKAWELKRDDIFAGFNDKKLITKLENYIESGTISDLSSEEAIYIDALTLFNSMGRKYGRRNTVRFFTKPPFSLKYNRAAEMYDEAVSLFYTDRSVEKSAIRNRYAEEIEEASIVVRDNAVTSKDWGVYADMIMKAAKLRELDKEDPDIIPPELYLPPVRLYSLNSEDIGLPKINRQAIADQIETLDIPERDKLRLRQDGLAEKFNIAERINELEEESKSEE